MDHGGTLRTVKHDQFEKVPRSVSTENQVSGWVLGDLLDDDGVANDMEDVLGGHSMTERRSEDFHQGIVLRNCPVSDRLAERLVRIVRSMPDETLFE